jgi:hypothetical protein
MWMYQGEEFKEEQAEGYVGFVYLIENIFTKKKYIGKKLFSFTRTKKVKGKTRRKKVTKQSDWQDYYGSNNQLKEDVKQFGVTCFRREILHLCKTKGTCSYLELKEQILHNALESENFYNDQIYVRIHRSHIKL